MRPRDTGRHVRGASALDGGVAVSAALLVGIGVVMVYSATAPLAMGAALPPHFVRHLVAVCVALVGIVIAMRVPLAAWRRLAIPLWLAAVVLLAVTLVVGIEVNGARRWLGVPGTGVSFQPGELAKWATLMALAAALGGGRGRAEAGASRRRVLALTLPPVALLMLQPDFGSAVILVALTGSMAFAAGLPIRTLLAPGAAALLAAGAYVGLRPYALARWKGFLDPWQTSSREGFQLVQSFVAFGRGGWAGVGIGDGRQKLFYLPEAHTDFMLSVVAEELGLLGVLVVLGAFAALVVAGTRIARRARDRFTLLVAFGMTALLTVPAAVNAAVVMGILPTTGLSLPFVSYGRSSLLACALALAILLRVSAWEAAPPGARRGWSPP